MVSSFTSQVWAVVRRYFITCLRYPTSSVLRLFIWPGLFFGLCFYILEATSDEVGIISSPENYAALVLSMSLIFHICHFINWLVLDKTTEFKSLMVLMGLRKKSYYFGTAVCMLACLLPVLVVSSAIAILYLFKETKTSVLVVICLIILFSFQLSSMIFFLASFITSTKAVYLIPILVLVERFLHDGLLWIMNKVTDDLAQPIILVLFSFSPFEAVRIFCDGYAACHNCNDGIYFYPNSTSDPSANEIQNLHDHVSQPIYQLLPAMLFWTIFYQLFAYWFDEICPYKTDSEIKSPFFCFQSGCTDSKFKSYNSGRNHTLNSNLFEMSANVNHEIGIQVKGLTKIFNNIPVVNNLDFSIYRGETTLLLGHNGAGKTTFMNMILHKITPDHGRVEIGKKSSRATSSGIGVCPQESILDDNLTVKQHLELFADIKNSQMTSQEQSDHIKSTLADVSLIDHADFYPEKLSGGMKRKLSLGMAFVGKSNILILDEPSSGLDPDSRVFVWDVIRRYRSERTVLLSTQHMEEADYLGDRIAIMSEGTIICCGSSLFLNKTFGTGYKLRVECDAATKPNVLNFVRSHFAKAKIIGEDELQSRKDSTVDFVIELNDDKTKDLEMKLITMLERMEEKASRDLRIKSYGLRSSSIEDVMLNTSKWLHSNEPSHKESTRLTIPLESNLSNLATPIQTQTGSCRILSALLLKHVHIYKNDWSSILVLRLLLPAFCSWLYIKTYSFNPIFFPSLFLTTLILHFIQYPSDEKQSGFKLVQLSSNAGMIDYWMSQFLIDSISFVANVILFCVIFNFTFSGLIISSELNVYLIISFGVLLCSVAGALMAYTVASILSIRQSPTGIFSVCFIASVGLSLIIMMVVLLSGPKMSWFYYLRWIFISTLPPDALSYILYGLGADCHVALYALPCLGYNLSHSPVMVGFIVLAAQIVFYGITLYLVETQRGTIGAVWNSLICTCCSRGAVKSNQREERIDQDVLDESEMAEKVIKSVDKDVFSLVATNLSKSYVRGVKVIDNLSFTVKRGECFGLLGVNGAGKSTTFSMIVADTSPDYGDIWLNGLYNSTSSIDSYRQTIGYDPQQNPDIGLTPVEAFTLMARLRGVPEDRIARLVDSLLEVLDMNEHRSKKARDLSGGTKRKLGLGMSLIGNPLMLALDEPTAGVDPMARRGVWRLLRLLRMQNNASILISSHAMEECEAICDRISIMAKGRLECIGTFLHLRNKFSQGCSIRVQFDQAAVMGNLVTGIIEQLNTRLREIIGQAGVKLVDTNANSATFNVSNNHIKRSQLFKFFRDFRKRHPHMSYTINDSSLEDIFLKMAKKQELAAQIS